MTVIDAEAAETGAGTTTGAGSDSEAAKALIAEYREALAQRKRRDELYGRIALTIAGVAAVPVLAVLLSSLTAGDIGGLSLIVAAIAAMLWNRFCVNVEETQRALDETAMAPIRDDDNDAKDKRERLVSIQRSLLLVRNRALSSLSYAVLFMLLGLVLLIYVAASVPDFLAQYASLYSDAEGAFVQPGAAEAAWIASYETELLGTGIVGTALIGWGLAQLVTARRTQREAERLDVERELVFAGTTPHGTLARKLFLLNGQGLDKYYDINRLNNRLAMLLSAACILIGVGITIWTVRLVLDTDPDRGQVIIAAVGAANTVMVHVVAAIVLRMQGTIWANVDTFHQRLVRTHELFLANVIAADLDTPEARRHSQALLARSIGERDAPTLRSQG